jgi:hypothetical protein
LVAEAEKAFDSAREIESAEEHAFVSHIQLLLRALDFGFRVSGIATREEFLAVEGTFREMVDRAETLFEDLQRLREGQEPSHYYTSCQTGLDELYGDHSRVIERWTNLLDRQDVYQPPVRRQLVRAYLSL